jgi:hypothetical protein
MDVDVKRSRGDYVRLRSLRLTSIAPTYAANASVAIIVARSTLRAIAFVFARCASLRLTSIAPTHAANASVAIVVARSTLRAITFVCARCASLRLTSIAPTHAATASVAIIVSRSTLRAITFVCARFDSHPSPLLTPLTRRLRASSDGEMSQSVRPVQAGD